MNLPKMREECWEMQNLEKIVQKFGEVRISFHNNCWTMRFNSTPVHFTGIGIGELVKKVEKYASEVETEIQKEWSR